MISLLMISLLCGVCVDVDVYNTCVTQPPPSLALGS